MGYVVRLHFYKGQSQCRVFVSLRNAELAALSPKSFDAAWIEVPLQLGSSRNVAFGFGGSGVSGNLSAGSPAHLFQADNTFQRSPRTDRITPYLCTADGVEISIALTVIGRTGVSERVRAGIASHRVRPNTGIENIVKGSPDQKVVA